MKQHYGVSKVYIPIKIRIKYLLRLRAIVDPSYRNF